jgi:hypothetical protein
MVSSLVSARPPRRAGTTGRSAAGNEGWVERSCVGLSILLAESSPVPVEHELHVVVRNVWVHVLVLCEALPPSCLLSCST